MALKFDGWPWKTIGHLPYAPRVLSSWHTDWNFLSKSTNRVHRKCSISCVTSSPYAYYETRTKRCYYSNTHSTCIQIHWIGEFSNMYCDAKQYNSSGLGKSMCMWHGKLLAPYDMPTTILIFILGQTGLSSENQQSQIDIKYCLHVKNVNKCRKQDIISKPLALQWRHNGRDGVSNHQLHKCLHNRLFRRRSKKTSKLCVTGLCAGNHRGPVNSPHKWPVTRKMFPFDDIIM